MAQIGGPTGAPASSWSSATTWASGTRRESCGSRVYRIHGPFLFGATDKLTNLTSHVDEMTPIVVLRLRNMTAIDATRG
jgi:MFS superfamily sulfate permease-like transporter